ncbi:unnamed protein product [Boreogadus saida]
MRLETTSLFDRPHTVPSSLGPLSSSLVRLLGHIRRSMRRPHMDRDTSNGLKVISTEVLEESGPVLTPLERVQGEKIKWRRFMLLFRKNRGLRDAGEPARSGDLPVSAHFLAHSSFFLFLLKSLLSLMVRGLSRLIDSSVLLAVAM